MKFEVLKRSHLKRNIIISVIVVALLSAIILTFTRAKYRTTQSMPLIQGTINFSPSDFNLIAMYLDKEGAQPAGQTKEVPKFGYDLDTENSVCYVGDALDSSIAITYIPKADGSNTSASLSFDNMTKSGTKCTIHFKLKEDTENPNLIISTSSTDTSITVTANATDNIGIYYYYFKLDSGEEVRLEENSYTFEGLTKGQSYTVSVRVEDAAGNTTEKSEDVIVGTTKSLLLANYPTVLTRTDFSTAITETTTGTIYMSMNESQYDDDGEVYYFAGNPTDNWVEFGGFWWRIIRINGDGTIRMIYQGTAANTTGAGTQIGESSFYGSNSRSEYVGYMNTLYQSHGLENASMIKEKIDTWYRSNLANYISYIDGNAGFCGDRITTNGNGIGTTETIYAASNRLGNKTPSYKCQDSRDLYTTSESSKGNKALEYPIGLITADEISFGGGLISMNKNNEYYLYTGLDYWTITPVSFSSNEAFVYYIETNGTISHSVLTINRGIRPVINLRADVQITGSGTTTDPFKVVGA